MSRKSNHPLSKWWACTRKIKYKSGKEAQDKANFLNTLEETKNPQHAYKCDYCDVYHVGRIPYVLANEKRKFYLACDPELGDREANCLFLENYGSEHDRLIQVKKRINSIFRKSGNYEGYSKV